jgi:hypothetical protein
MSLWERSRFIIGADSYFARVGLAPSDAAPVPIADHASHGIPDDPGRGHEYDEALAGAVPSTQTNSNGWSYIVDADHDSFHLRVSPYGVEDVPSGAGNALMSDLASVSDFSPRFFGGDCVALCQSTGNSTGVDDNGTHADQLPVFDVFSGASVGAPIVANGTRVGFVDVSATPLGQHTPSAASPLITNEPATSPPLTDITDGPIGVPPGTVSSTPATHVNVTGATAAQLLQALGDSGLSVNGSGIKVGVLSDSFNDLGGAAGDEADGALPAAADIDVIKDLASGGTDEGRAMMQIIHEIAPGASLAFYTAFDSEQDFADGILALAAAGCKIIVDDVSYFDEPFFQNGIVAQAIQTVEAEGVTYVTAAGNNASNGYQAAWTSISGAYDGYVLSDAESFGGSLVQKVSINTEGTGDAFPLLLEWNQGYGTVSASTADLEMLVFNINGQLVGTATNVSSGEPTNPWLEYNFSQSGTYYVAIENLNPNTNPGLIKEIAEGDGVPFTIFGSNLGTVYGHAMTPAAITTGAVSAADTPAFGFNTPVSEGFSSSGDGTELLFANNGTALSSPDPLSPVAISGIDDIHTTVSDLSDFYGTSAAAASLAGVAALLLSANPSLSPAQGEQIIEASALPMANSAVSGAGLVQIDPAIADALTTLVGQLDAIYNAVLQGPPSGSVIVALEAVDQGQGENAVVTAVVENALGVPNSNLNPGVLNFDAPNPYSNLIPPDLVPTLEMFQLAFGYFPQNASNLNSIVNSGLTLTQLSDAVVNSQTFANVFDDGVILNPNSVLVPGFFGTNFIDALFQSSVGHLPTASTVAGFDGYTISQAFLAFVESQTYYNSQLSVMTQYLTELGQNASTNATPAIVGSVAASTSVLEGHTSVL